MSDGNADGRLHAMYTTIDEAGRIVIPKALRERAGLYAGVRIAVSGDDEGIKLTPEFPPPRLERRGRLTVIVRPESAGTVDDQTVETIRDEIARERADACLKDPGS